MEQETTIKQWLSEDSLRMQALVIAARCNLPDWCLAAGFVRNLVWDKVHQSATSQPLNDIDLIYFNPSDISEQRDRLIEQQLHSISKLPWSVKNQARMHLRNNDNPYNSTLDAMSYWVEIETAVGARLDEYGNLVLVSPFGLNALFEGTVSLNPKRPKLMDFNRRITDKKWLEIWPALKVNSTH
ncbi:MAG: nucleotidyltransferase family protein [Gammaproteobacteria bacterium]|nr:nucleotidyltransferase family protein [Gammaproteobacteria bacterium]MBU2225747.1 nucleotidyltransferase family protein [Gammaproteobacteria bacterium]MBU2280488.1 nucleotidyltransferase family protein [Gammaproteobacteria bacterium]MBU2428475.1 nucleotidyltransferase family protein [Gammaproteobacteria bacterium]